MQSKTISKRIIISSVIIILALGVILILAYKEPKEPTQKNGFNRNMIAEIPILRWTYKNSEGITDFVGLVNGNYYFRTTEANRYIVFDTAFTAKKEIHISAIEKYGLEIINSNFTPFFNDNDSLFVLAGNIPSILIGSQSPDTITQYGIQSSLFTLAVKISSSSFILRGFETNKSRDQIFIKIQPTENKISYERNISEKKGDAGLSTDGNLDYDETTGLISYVQYYNNKILCFDTTLSMRYEKHTIDTNIISKTYFGAVKDGENTAITNTTPKIFINWHSEASNGKLYINSMLQADNQPTEDFKRNSTIDVYNIRNAEYIGSFYLPLNKHTRFKEFKILDNKVFIIFSDQIFCYNLPPSINSFK